MKYFQLKKSYTNSNFFFIILLSVQFLISRVIIFFSSAKFDIRDLSGLGQHLDIKDLTDSNFIEILINLNSQPPLWNILISSFLKLSHGNIEIFEIIFYAFHLGLSFCITILIFFITHEVSNNKLLALITASIYVSLSSSYFYELLLFYPLLTAFLMTSMIGGLVFLLAENSSNKAILIFGIFSILSAFFLGLTWSLFHPLIIIFFSIYILYIMRIKLTNSFFSKNIKNYFFLIMIFFVTLINFAWPIKNYVLFREFSSSTWLGMNLAQVSPINLYKECNMYNDLLPAEINESRKISKFMDKAESNFSVDKYKNDIKNYKVVSSQIPNMNHIGYVSRSKKCKSLFFSSLKKEPHIYLFKRMQRFLFSHTILSDNFWYSPLNLEVDSDSLIKSSTRIRNLIYFPIFKYKSRQHHLAPLVFPLFYILFPVYVLKNKNQFFPNTTTKNFFLASLFFFLWLEIAGHLLNGGEQERMRFTIEPLFLSFAANLIYLFFKRLKFKSFNKLKI